MLIILILKQKWLIQLQYFINKLYDNVIWKSDSRQRLTKHATASTNTRPVARQQLLLRFHTTEELFEAVFSMLSDPRLYNQYLFYHVVVQGSSVVNVSDLSQTWCDGKWITRADWEELVLVVVSSKYEWKYVSYLDEIAELRKYISREPTKQVTILSHWGEENFLVGQLVDHIDFTASLSVIPDIEEIVCLEILTRKLIQSE
jgi:hypothetical protein